MPFIQRIVEPTHVSRVEVGTGIQNELECVTNHSLANIIRQLSTLSKHAEDMFSELYQETNDFFKRASQLNNRVEHLRVTVTQLNPTEEIVSLQDIHLRKPYHSSNQHDQQVVSKTTISRAILQTYNKCEKPPALDKLNQYREDGKDCMKFYTDPGYFFELWFKEIQRDIDSKKAELRQKKKNRGPNREKRRKGPREVQSKQDKYRDMAQGAELSSQYQVPKIKQMGGISKPAPAGMVQHNTPGLTPPKHQHLVQKDNRTNVPEQVGNHVNHIDTRGSRQMNGPYTQPNSQYIEEAQPNQTEVNNKLLVVNHRDSQRQSQNVVNHRQMSPKDRRVNRNTSNSMIGNRPSMAPPPPPPLGFEPEGINRQDRANMSPQRESLPPPPPPPSLEPNQNQNSPQQAQPLPGMTRGQLQRFDSQGSPGGSPIRHINEDQDLPPPPPPPQAMSPDMPPPPPPILQGGSPAPQGSVVAPPPPPPPPLPPAQLPLHQYNQQNQLQQPADNVSLNSDYSTSSTGTSATTRDEPPPQPPKETGRSALLDEIRNCDWRNRLQKAEDRKKKAAAPQHDNFDVHSVMTRAFEMRQKAMADSDSDEDDDFDDDWET